MSQIGGPGCLTSKVETRTSQGKGHKLFSSSWPSQQPKAAAEVAAGIFRWALPTPGLSTWVVVGSSATTLPLTNLEQRNGPYLGQFL